MTPPAYLPKSRTNYPIESYVLRWAFRKTANRLFKKVLFFSPRLSCALYHKQKWAPQLCRRYLSSFCFLDKTFGKVYVQTQEFKGIWILCSRTTNTLSRGPLYARHSKSTNFVHTYARAYTWKLETKHPFITSEKTFSRLISSERLTFFFVLKI